MQTGLLWLIHESPLDWRLQEHSHPAYIPMTPSTSFFRLDKQHFSLSCHTCCHWLRHVWCSLWHWWAARVSDHGHLLTDTVVPPLVTHRTIRSSYHRATAHKLTLTCNTAPIHLSWSTTKEKRKKIKERRKKKKHPKWDTPTTTTSHHHPHPHKGQIHHVTPLPPVNMGLFGRLSFFSSTLDLLSNRNATLLAVRMIFQQGYVCGTQTRFGCLGLMFTTTVTEDT